MSDNPFIMESDTGDRLVLLPNGQSAIATAINATKATIICWSCKTRLEYEQGAQTVQCGVCRSLNGTQQRSSTRSMFTYRCAMCNNILRVPIGCLAVRCEECQTVSLLNT